MAPVNILNLILCTVNMILLPYLAGYGFLHVLGIKPDKVSVLAHMSLDKPQEFAAELDAVLRSEEI